MDIKVVLVFAVIFAVSENHRVRHGKRKKSANEKDVLFGDGASNDPSLGVFVYVTVSEINTDTLSDPPKRFLELHTTRNLNRPLGVHDNILLGWRLLMIKGTTLEVVMSIDLSSHLPHHSSSYIVIGDDSVPKIDISLWNEKTEVAFTKNDFPDFDNSAYCFVVVSTVDAYSANLLSLPREGGKFKTLNLLGDDERQRLVYALAWDAVVVGRGTNTNQCNFCTSLFPTGAFKDNLRFLLRDRDVRSVSTNDYSLNNCCDEIIPFSPYCFKLGHPTPGADNDCSGRRFILEFEMNSIAAARQPVVFIDQNEENCPVDFPGIEPYQYPLIHDHDYAQAVARVMRNDVCPNVESMDVDEDTEENPPGVESNSGSSNTAPKKYLEEFDRSNFLKCRHHFSRPDELLRPLYSLWLDVHPIGDECETAKIKCRICATYLNSGWRADKKHRKHIQEEGYFDPSKYENQRAVKNHLSDPIHVEAAYFYGLLEFASSRHEQLQIEAKQHEREKKRLKPTMNEVALAYTELRARTSFRSHGLFMDTISELGVNVGFKHRHEKAIEDISKVLSTEFHKRLLTRLVNEKPFFSLICDGTTNRQVPYLVCLLQTLEKNHPIVYFWGLIVITTGENGYNMVEDVKIRVGDDDKLVPGFEEFFKAKIIASVSDSASNMAGAHNSFYVYLKAYVGGNIALVKCGAHKLQRAILHGLDFPTDEEVPGVDDKDRKRYFKDFLKINNGFYTFYMSRGSKRFQEFVELAEELDLHAYRINYFFDVRWAASHKKCMHTLYHNYDALRADLSRIVSDSGFEEAAKSKAVELYNHLVDKTFIIVVSEFADMLTSFEFMSKRFQEKGGIMIANTEIIRDGYSDLVDIRDDRNSETKKDFRKYVKDFLKRCSCGDVCSKGHCTLQQYDECHEVIYDDSVSLTDRTDGRHTIHLSEFRIQLYDNILSQLVSYFPPAILESFEVLNPKNFKACTSVNDQTNSVVSCEDLKKCYNELPTIVPGTLPKTTEENFHLVCGFYSIDSCDDLLIEWKKTLASILTKASTIVTMENDPAKFWPLMLENDDIVMNTPVRELLERVLVTSFTSADAERAFSMVTNRKTQDRTNMAPKTLENLVRLSFNGPEKLSEESLFEYTKAFVRRNSRVDDPTAVGGHPPNPEAYKSFFKKSQIF